MQVEVNQTKCIGSFAVFKLGDDGKAHIMDTDGASDDMIRNVAKTCLQEAIILNEDKGNQIYPES